MVVSFSLEAIIINVVVVVAVVAVAVAAVVVVVVAVVVVVIVVVMLLSSLSASLFFCSATAFVFKVAVFKEVLLGTVRQSSRYQAL